MQQLTQAQAQQKKWLSAVPLPYLRLWKKLKEAYVAVNPDADIEIQTSDSTTGMTDAAAGTCDIGMASRDLKDEELAAGLTNTVIANDGIAVIVNKENPVNNLTKDQIMNIYTGNVTAWDDITEE